MLASLFSRFFLRRRARAQAEAACRRLRPGAPIVGTWLCAEEPERFVVRVFCGTRAESLRAPQWNECLVFAVTPDAARAELLVDDVAYRPTVR
jgi:hypothetical protein